MTWSERCDEFLEGLNLANEQAIDRLISWLDGHRLALQPDADAYLLLRRMAVSKQRMDRLSELTKLLLDRWIEGAWQPDTEAAYQLLHLAAEIKDPERLASRVWRLYTDRLPQGEHLSIPLRDVLLEAMILNQGEEQRQIAEPLWKTLLSGQIDEYVGGDVEQGYRGLIVARPTSESLIEALNALFQRANSRDTVIQLLHFAREVHPGMNLDMMLDDFKAEYNRRFLTELTRRRNWTARKLRNQGYGPEDMTTWNQSWRQVVRSAAEDLERNPPLLAAEREELLVKHLNQQFQAILKHRVSRDAYKLLCVSARQTS